MKKNKHSYPNLNESSQAPALHEPEMVYISKAQAAEPYPIITQRELEENCMTLDEFFHRLEEKIYNP